MSLAALKAAGPIAPRKGPGCTVGTLLRSLPTSDADALADMLDDDVWQSEAIAKAVTSEVGVRLRGHTVARHRRGLCACEPVACGAPTVQAGTDGHCTLPVGHAGSHVEVAA